MEDDATGDDRTAALAAGDVVAVASLSVRGLLIFVDLLAGGEPATGVAAFALSDAGGGGEAVGDRTRLSGRGGVCVTSGEGSCSAADEAAAKGDCGTRKVPDEGGGP